jgi:hypothetical protein
MATNKPAREFIDASANSLSSSLIDKSIIIILAGQSHAVCAAITDETYLKQVNLNKQRKKRSIFSLIFYS